MSDIVIQASFSHGEWAPALYARVDVQAYRAACALAQNFFIDYRGGVSTRPGSRYVLQAYKSSTSVRVITFQASFNIGYALEFGDRYIRFVFQGNPILETGFAISGITRADPAVVTATGNDFSTGDWVFITAVNGMGQIDSRYFSVLGVSGASVTLGDLNNVALDTTAYGAYTSGGTIQRVYTLASPYAAADLALLKFAQIQGQMVLCHPAYPPYLLTLVTATNWTIATIVFESTATAPANVAVTTTLDSDQTNYSYVVTALDASGQESTPSAPAQLLNTQDIRTVSGSNQITWSPSPTGVAYNVYESEVSYFGVVPQGITYGFIGTTKGTSFIDSNIAADFSETPPVQYDPFTGSGLAFLTITIRGVYTTVPTISFSGGSPAIPGTAGAVLDVNGIPAVASGGGGTGFAVGDTVSFGDSLVLRVATESGGVIATYTVVNPGSITSGSVPSNPISQIFTSGSGVGAQITAAWGVGAGLVLTTGAGYLTAPTPIFSTGSATATATLGATSNGNPGVPSFFQQRLVLAAPSGAPDTFYMSQPGSYFNFNITDPVQASNSITETLVSTTAESIKSIVSSTSGMLVLTDKSSWLVNGGSSGSAVSPTAIVASKQSSRGANDVPPIVANYDVLFVDSKGSAVRDLAYNIYFNVFTGTDISINSSHLFFGYEILQWAWAEAPFYVVWAVRNDGVMLTLTFLKEQEFIGWTHQVTNGTYKSVCAVTESTSDAGNVDAIYTVVTRVVNGFTVQYIERIADRVFPNGVSSAWCVDAGVQYSGAPANTFSGAEHLAGLTVTGLADGNVIAPFVMPVSGIFTLPAMYSTVTVGEGFVCQLQTLAIDVSQPPIQGKLKKIPYVDVRVNDTLNLQIGATFATLVPMKDTIQGNVSSMLTGIGAIQQVNGLYSGDARTILDPSYNVFGQYCIQQSLPLPATILGVFPCIEISDS